jgi:rhodanese-related sulfurtransferase
MQLISAPELASWLENDKQPKPVLLDVRELSEVQRCQIPGSIHMAMQTVPLRYNELDQETPIVCICHHGVRSMQVAQYLKQQGFESIFNLTGGIHAWATQVDPDMGTY